MSQIEITCIDQTSIFTNTPEIFSGDVNVDTVKFKFDDSWDDYVTKTAVFYNNVKEVYTQILNESYVAVIPKEVMSNKCKLSIGVFGTNVNGDVKTSKILTYNIGKGAISDDLGTNPPTLDIWVQLLTRIIAFEDKIQTDFDELSEEVETLEGIAKGRNQALAYNSYSEMITTLNSMSADELKRGQNIYIATLGVPDLWVYGVETNKVTYNYVDDDTFVEGLNVNTTVQVGYYKLAQLETQKVDVGGITNDINTLQEDVEALEGDLTALESGVASERLLWNISDEIYEDSTELNITKFENTFRDMLFYNNELYILTNTSSAIVLSKWTNNAWSTVATKSYSAVYMGALIEYKGDLYIGVGAYTYGDLLKLNGSSLTTIKSVNASSGRFRVALCKDVENDLLYFGYANYEATGYIGYVTYNGTSVSTSVNTIGGSSKIYLYDFHIVDDKLYINYKLAEGTYYIEVVWDLTTGKNTGSKSMLNYVISQSKEIGNNTYIVSDSNTLCKFVGLNFIEKLDCVRGMCPYGDSFLIYRTYEGGFSSVKLYKIATSYATKGAKIYTPNSLAISDNLEPIDNGYLVTADGEVKIGVYDY